MVLSPASGSHTIFVPLTFVLQLCLGPRISTPHLFSHETGLAFIFSSFLHLLILESSAVLTSLA